MHSMKTFAITVIILFVMLTSLACSSPVKITEKEAAPSFMLSNYSTFGFYEEELQANERMPAEYAPYVALLKREITRQFQAKGLQYSLSSPDIMVNLGLSVDNKTQTRTTNYKQDAPYYSGQRRYTWKSQEVPVGRYKEGTVIMELVDRTKNELVWKAEAVSVLPNKSDTFEERIIEGVQKLFKEF